jgi:Rieske Fe-S protein
VSENLRTGLRLVRNRLASHESGLPELEPGEGAVVELDGEKVAASKDEHGQVHAVSAVCTHLGCTVDWNGAEQTWDCPCHGSRFDSAGHVIQGPATKDLAPTSGE